ncbi:hypothetical protein BCM02_11046 [Paenibacillus methanolicus]|uniref:Uncharacterized protein n=1 Tax=Paenibacillus methanolicus TaxID=582686 RepID=A0A5S5BVN6_9BACL|nr:hypothetical protein BCM02_11046 [Paenibacillus methanolicus]
MDTPIIQNHDDVSLRISIQNHLKKLNKSSCVVTLPIPIENFACFVIKHSKQLGSFMAAKGGDFSLVTNRKPVILEGLIRANHAFIFKQKMIDLSIYKLFFSAGNVLSVNVFCSSGSANAIVYVAFV